MRELQTTPDPPIKLADGTHVIPIATLADKHGEKSHIIIDDSCYVLMNSDPNEVLVASPYWPDEAVSAMQKLPAPTEKRKEVVEEMKKGVFKDYLSEEEKKLIESGPKS